MNDLVRWIRRQKTSYILLVLLALSLIIRLWGLGTMLRTFQEDEVLSGYVGKFIVRNGMDIYGNKWPLLYFNKFDDYYIIGPMYLVGISLKFLGTNVFAVRFPTALIGALIVLPVYYLSYEFFQRRLTAYISSFFAAVLPWHIVLSRGMAEGVIGTTIFLTGIVMLIRSYKHSHTLLFYASAALLFLSYWTYHPFRLYAPLVFIPLYLFIPFRGKKTFLYKVIFVHSMFCILTGYIAFTPWGNGRLKQTSIFSDLSGVQMKIQQAIYNTGEQRVVTARIYHNKIIGFGREYIHQYLTYFSPNYLFIQPQTESRYDVPDQGLLFYTMLIGIVIGMLNLWHRNSEMQRMTLFLFGLIILAPIPAAFTYYGSPNVHRSILLGILLMIPSAFGWQIVFESRWRNIGVSVFLVLMGGELLFFFHQYTTQSDIYTSLRRNDGFVELAQYLKDHEGEYDRIYVPAEGNTALYYLFAKDDFSPHYVGKFGRDAQIGRIGNISFVTNTCASEVLSQSDHSKRLLVVNRHSCAEASGLKKVGEVKGVNTLLGFRLYTPQ